jgi:hypothetical protein
VPKWPSYTPTQHRYEVCIFQRDPDNNELTRMNCKFKEVAVTTQANDGDSRCVDPSCLKMSAIGKHNQGNWDLLQLDIKIPGKAQDDADVDELLWDIVIPYSDDKDTYYGTVTCTNEYWNSGDTYFGLHSSEASDYPHTIIYEDNSFQIGVSMSVANKVITLTS